MPIRKQFVSSSSIEALGYSEEKKTLRVWFHTGSVYDYANVPKKEFEQLLHASSIGSHYNYHIKNVYSYTKVR